jgi:hypothetical protein
LGASQLALLTRYDAVKKDTTSRTCGTHEEQTNACKIFEGKDKRDHWEDKDVGGWIILKWILEMEWGGMDLIYLAHDRDQWRSLVKAVTNLRVLQKMLGNS